MRQQPNYRNNQKSSRGRRVIFNNKQVSKQVLSDFHYFFFSQQYTRKIKCEIEGESDMGYTSMEQ